MTPEQALSNYQIGPIKKITRLTDGLIHASYKVEADGSFVLQNLHPQLSSPETADDYIAVTDHLKSTGIPTIKLIKDKTDRNYIFDDNRSWRLINFINGTTAKIISEPPQAEKLGFALGQFHLAMKDCDHDFKSPLRLHESKKIWDTLVKILDANKNSAHGQTVATEAKFLTEILPQLFLPDDLPQAVVHGDPQASNFIFGPDGRVTLIDLDTCMRHTPLVDLGDAFRSWANLNETDPQFSAELFKAGLQGYKKAAPNFLNAREKQFIVQSVKLITAELATRFLVDYFEDHYFDWDKEKFSSRRDHNLARCREQIKLYKDIDRKEKSLENIVHSVL